MEDSTKFTFIPTPWAKWAACKGMDPNLFQPEVGNTGKEAKEVCNGIKATKRTPGRPPCPVKTECLQYAMSFTKLIGVFGGTNERDRRTLRSKTPMSRKLNANTKFRHGTLNGYNTELRLGLEPCKACKKVAHQNRTVFIEQPGQNFNKNLEAFVSLVKVTVRSTETKDHHGQTIRDDINSEHGQTNV